MSTPSPHKSWNITEVQREIYRQRSTASSRAKKQALNGEGETPIHPINIPNLNPEKLMPQMPKNKWRTLSLFSGGVVLTLALTEQVLLILPPMIFLQKLVILCVIFDQNGKFFQVKREMSKK